MLQDLAAALALFAHWENVLALIGGVGVGVLVGAIPGMTSTMGVALTLPFTFTLPPVTGILLLLGVYKGGVYGGSIPAILVKAPGTPAASCTILDGYPMARRGEAGRALDIALYSSCFADLVSNLSLILFAGALAMLAQRFGPPEYFTLIAFSLTIIAGVSGERLTKGLIGASLGLILATVGLDLVYGTNRFVFDNPDLMAGLSFIPVLIGLFALPEILDYYSHRVVGEQKILDPGKSHASFADFRRCFKTIMRGSLIGVVMGAIPGIGGAPAAFMSYSEAKRTSPRGNNFGKGEIEGVAAAESGNNGTAGATMIPLLALGIPGDVITAVILGAFMIHGLRPGPLLFQQNIDLIYALFMGIALSSVFLLVIGKAAIRIFRRIASIPYSILFPIVLVLCVYGAYAINNSFFDVLVMMVMGIVGLIMLRFDIPTAPFLIAFILGPMLEDNFRRSLLLSRGSLDIFFRNEITWLFWSLTALSILLIVRRNWRRRTPAEGPAGTRKSDRT